MTNEPRGNTKEKKKKYADSHQRSWLWGRRAVMEVLRHQRWPINQLYLGENLDDEERDKVAGAAIDMGLTVQIEPARRLQELCHNRQHQGFLARMAPFPYTSFEQMIGLLAAPNLSTHPLVAVLDAVQDPYNFGAILRSAEVLDVRATLVGTEGQVGVNSHVARSSAGAVNRIPICREEDPAHALSRLKSRGVKIVGASEKAEDTPCTDFDFDCPVALILGNEGKGISRPLLNQCDAMVSVPQSGEIGSLNVAVAASILFYEAQRQKRIKPLETETDNEQRDV